MSKEDQIILGIDPGTTIMGFGLIRIQKGEIKLIQMHELQLKKYDNHYLKLQQIFTRTLGLIKEYHPDQIAIEAPFFGKNVQSMLKLGRAQGVAMAAGLYREVPITEYSPNSVKKNLIGYGHASKFQMIEMIKRLYPEVGVIEDNAADALAVATCHSMQTQSKIQN